MVWPLTGRVVVTAEQAPVAVAEARAGAVPTPVAVQALQARTVSSQAVAVAEEANQTEREAPARQV